MKRICAALFAALMLGLCVCGALAQTEITVYVSKGALPQETAAQLVQLLQRAMPEAAFTAVCEEETGQTLYDLVLADMAPQLAICRQREAAPWAQEGLLMPSCVDIAQTQRVADAVISACTWEDEVYMTPLLARHRHLAVNRKLLRAYKLDYLLDFREYPVWMPMQLYQVLEEAAIAGGLAMELWPVLPEESEAIAALVQSLYHGLLLSEDGKTWQADSDAVISGVEWFQSMVDCGLIGMADSREDALDRFLAGETALFIDWTHEEAALLKAQGTGAIEVATVPYPSSSGLPLHSFDVVGAAVFLSGDEQTDALAGQAAAFLSGNAQVRRVLGEQGIYEDGATWLYSLDTHAQGAVMRSALCAALDGALAGTVSAQAAMEMVQAILESL